MSQQIKDSSLLIRHEGNNGSSGESTECARAADPSLSPDLLPKGFENVATVVCRLRPENRVVGSSQNYEFGGEKFRFLRHRLSQLRHRRPVSILITSSVPKEGKTLVAVNLAVSLARSSHRVALVDADLRHPSVQSTLGLPLLPGLAEFLQEKADLGSTLRRVDPLGFYYLPAGKSTGNPFELLESPRMGELLAQATGAFEWVVIDSPPLVPFADAHHLSVLCDAVLLVARPRVAPRDMLRQVLNTLDGEKLAGVVLNATDDKRHDDYYYHYYPRDSSSGKSSSRAGPISIKAK